MKIRNIKYIKTLFIIFAAINSLLILSQCCFAQKPHLDASQLKEGLIELNFKDSWRYMPGDDLDWANPELNDATWYNVNPVDLKAYNMPDSLWTGYGWWRIKFTTNSQLVNDIERLYFYTWGAAEIYLDGELVETYGVFSKDSKQEKNYAPNYDGDRPLKIIPHGIHTLAIRFSNHQAKKNHKIFRYFSEDLGFNIGFSTAVRAKFSDHRYANSLATLAVIAVVLSILLLLHILLYFKFRKEKSNLIISLITFLFLCAAIFAHILLFVDLDGFTNPIYSSILNSTSYGLGYGLLPYSLCLIFRIEKFYWTKHIVWIAFIRSANYFIKVFNFIIFDATLILTVIILMIILMRIAIKEKNKGVHFVTFGAIGTSVFLLVNRMINTGIVSLSTSLYYVDLIMLYICFPLGIYIYITNQFGRLFIAMEQEVEERTHDLNVSIGNLTKTQNELSSKNDENVLLLKEIHHRVKNNLEIVSSLLELQSSQIDDPSVQAAMQESQNRVLSMGIIHQKLYQGQNLASIEMKDYFLNLSENILNSFNANEKITVNCDMPELVLDVDTAITIGLITNELLTNSFKYAFEGKTNGNIYISLNEDQINSQNLELKISDDGIGKNNAGEANGTGFGSVLINLLTKQLNGKLNYKNENGTTVTLSFKKPKSLL